MIRHITLPKGFRAAGVTCGIKPSGKPDVAFLASDAPCSTAVVTTSNQIFGEPIRWVRSILPKGYGQTRGMLINSGNSNVCTGKAGFNNAANMAKQAAAAVGAKPEEMLVASTGVIGRPLPMDKIRKGIAAAGAKLARRDDSAFLKAIMTTDTREKSAVVQVNIGGKTVTVAGVVKGAGMIAPSLATMIGVVTTDANITPVRLNKLLKAAVKPSFNAVTVDTDQSTSDIVAAFASGASGVKIAPNTSAWTKFATAFNEVCLALARAIAADGEGATRLIEVRVHGAVNDRQAEVLAKSVADSPLVKTQVHGADPNWGRIAMALGKVPARSAVVDGEKLIIKLCGTTVFSKGKGRPFNEKALSKAMTAESVVIDCNLNLGKGAFTALTCDLSREYITINADYTT